MKTKLTKKDIAKIEKETYFNVYDYEDYYSFQWFTDAGEDFSFEVNKGKDLIEDIKSYCFNFDTEEHATMWYGANKGEPSSIRDLLDDADAIAEQLGKLAYVVDNL